MLWPEERALAQWTAVLDRLEADLADDALQPWAQPVLLDELPDALVPRALALAQAQRARVAELERRRDAVLAERASLARAVVPPVAVPAVPRYLDVAG